jgi:hypothetical protein
MDKHRPERQLDDPEIIRAAAGQRIGALVLLLVLAAVGAVVVFVVKARLDAIGLQAKEDLPAAVEHALELIQMFCWFNCVCFLGIGTWLWWLGIRIRRADRFPPPGMKVVRDTRVCTGAKARSRARAAQAMALLCVAVATGGMWFVYRLAETALR